MDYLFGELERIIDEIESNDDYSQDDVIQILKKYKERRAMGAPEFGPYFPKSPERILKRAIRGMLPYKKGRGREAFENVKCYKGVPSRFSGKELMSLDRAKIKPDALKFISLERLSSIL